MNKRTFLKTSGALAAGVLFAPLGCRTREPVPGRTNWAGNIRYNTDRLYAPATIDELQDIVQGQRALRVMGSRHCFNTIADSDSSQVSLEQMNRVITMGDDTVTVEAGMRYGDLCPLLHAQGRALHNLASLPHINIAGAIATATHGSGRASGNLATAVRGLELVDATGEIITVTRRAPGGKIDPIDQLIVHLGGYGVITKVMLATEPSYDMVQNVYLGLPVAGMNVCFDEVMDLGDSVSIFTDWQTDESTQIWIKRRVTDALAELEPELYGAMPATRNVHPVLALDAANCTEQMGVPGPWYERLPHFRMGFTPSSGEELQSEYFVDAEAAPDVIGVLRDMGRVLNPLLMISEVRTVAADTLMMSPAFLRDCVAFHFTWHQDADRLAEVLPQLEAALEPFEPRPHWGKNFMMPPEVLRDRYEMIDVFASYTSRSDPEGKFRNDFMNQYIYE